MRSALVGAVALVAGCAAHVPFDYQNEPDPRRQEYTIGVADLLRVTVWKNPDLSTEARVRPDGTITMPLVGDLVAAGRTPGHLKADILQKLAAFVKEESAIVTIAVVEANSYRLSVAGNVEHPGIYTSKYFVTIAEAITLAGGPSRFASSGVTLVRTDADGKVRRIPIDYRRIVTGRHPDEDLALFSGDAVFLE